jgi:hypothetical protein
MAELETALEASALITYARLKESAATTIHLHGLSAVVGEINASAFTLAK